MKDIKLKKRINNLFIFLIVVVNFSISSFLIDGKELVFTDEEKAFIESHKTITIGVDPEFRPYEFIDSDSSYKGIAADYLKIIEDKTGLTFQLKEGLVWEDAYDLALSGDIDMLPCVGKTTQRERFFTFTDSYLKFQRVIFSNESGPVYDFDDLATIRVGVQRNSSHYSFLTEFDTIQPVLYTTNDEMLLALSSGEIDAIVSNYASASYRIKEIGLTGIKVDTIINDAVNVEGNLVESVTNELAMAINKDLKPLASIINKVLQSITEEEAVNIRNKWLGFEKPADYSQIIRFIIVAAIIVFIIISMFLIYGVLLKKEIKRRKIIEAELVIAKKSAEKANDAKSIFLAHMSHEIRTPLNAVTGLAFLLENTKTSQVQNKYIKNIKDASYNLLGIINDILDFSKIEAGEVDIEIIEFSLDHLLDKIGNLLMPKATSKGIGFHVKKDLRIEDTLISDPTKIEQILINLVNNAIKFTQTGTVNIEVSMEEELLEGYRIRFSVKDTGIGITKEQMKYLFTPFHQLDSSVTRKYGGTGLGLSISKNLVELLGGNIQVDSEEEKGSSFTFIIPVKVKRELKNREMYPDFRNVSVLLFDEDIESSKIVTEYLQAFKLKTVIVDNYQSALKEISTGKFDLLMMELNIAGVDSIEFVSNYAKHMTVIFLAKQVLESQYEQAQEVGVNHIIMKPIISSILYNSLVQSLVRDFETEISEVKKIKKGTEAKILLVEDNEVNQMIEREILEQQGYHVIIAENGKVAYDYIKSGENADIILMDIHMPIMDGYEATELIRKINSEIPILAMTAVSFSNIENKYLAVGMNDYVTKPVEPEKLFETVEKYIKVHKRLDNQDLKMKSEQERIELLNHGAFIDMKQGLTRIGNNQKLYFEVLQKFYEDTRISVEVVNKYILNMEYEEAKKLVHKIKGTSGNVGATYLYQSAKILMEVLRQNVEVDLGPYIWEYESDLVNTLDTIKRLLEKHGVEQIKLAEKECKHSDEEEQLLIRLRELLRNSDIDAFNVYDEIYKRNECVDLNWKIIKEKMENYQFKEAYDVLDAMMTKK